MQKNNVEKMMADYVDIQQGDINKDLKKFRDAAPKKSVYKLRLASAFCILLLLGAASAYLFFDSQMKEREISDAQQTVLLDYFADMSGVASPDNNRVTTLQQQMDLHNFSSSLLSDVYPRVPCMQIRLTQIYWTQQEQGLFLSMSPADNQINSIALYYFLENYRIAELGDFEKLENQEHWSGMDIQYSITETADGYTYKMMLPCKGVKCYITVELREYTQIVPLLEKIFE